MKILTAASAIPEHSTSNEEIEQRLGLEPGWIERRTGIRHRPQAEPTEATSDLAVRAGQAAIESAGIDPGTIGLVLLATSTPDHLLPPTAPLVTHRLGLRAGAIDLTGACSGFLYALVLGSLWTDALGKAALILGANILTRRVPQDDASSLSLFSDGAGAVVIAPSQPSALLGSFLASDGSAYDTIGIPAGGTRQPLTPENVKQRQHLMTIRRGTALFRQAVHGMAEAGKAALEQARLNPSEIAWWIPHQANVRILKDAGALLEIGPERTISVVSQYGNSSAATIPIAMAHAIKEGRLKRGDNLLLTVAGAGLITAGAVIRW
jgi:3-oxoacyl-[acyl-carrier-protein] synthase-3